MKVRSVKDNLFDKTESGFPSIFQRMCLKSNASIKNTSLLLVQIGYDLNIKKWTKKLKVVFRKYKE